MENNERKMVLQLTRISARSTSVLKMLVPLITDPDAKSLAEKHIAESDDATEQLLSLIERSWLNEQR